MRQDQDGGDAVTVITDDTPMFECVICKQGYIGYGNNAQPLADGRACDACNDFKVIPARINPTLLAKFKKELEAKRG